MLWSLLKGAAEIGMGIYQRITEEDGRSPFQLELELKVLISDRRCCKLKPG